MKTILIAHNYTENSFAYMSYYLARSIALEGNKVVFISYRPFFNKAFDENIENGKLIVYSWPTEKRPVKFRDAIWFAKLYLKYKPSVIISHFVSVNITIIVSKILSLGKVKTFPYYHTLSSQIQQDVSSSFLKRAIKKVRKQLVYSWFADAIVCPSDLAKQDLKICFRNSKGIKIVNPIRDRFKEKKVLNNDFIEISYLGRLEPSKGVIDLVNAFLKYKIEYPKSRIILNIAGSGSQYNEIKELAENQVDISFLGALPYNEIDSYLNKSHYAIIPSKFDNLPTVGLEAMMNGTPILISDNTGLSLELIDGVECFKFSPTMEEMIVLFGKVEKNSMNHKIMSSNARKIFLEKFGVENYSKTIKKIIDRN